MERNAGIRGLVLTLAIILCQSCSFHEAGEGKTDVKISFSSTGMQCRSVNPDEGKISDVSLMIFDETGAAEECIYLKDGTKDCSVKLIIGKKYILCACANFGYRVYADNMEELSEIKYHMAYPDEYRQGMPMYACQEISLDGTCSEIALMLERLMAKISLQIDRRRLSDDVQIFVRSVQVGNCPKSVKVFEESKVEDEDDCFPAGFSRLGSETDPLNKTSENGLSGSISLYMLENMQGILGKEAEKDSDKVFDKDDYKRGVCSFIELDMEYSSDRFTSGEKGLVYRFYLGGSRNDLNIGRNCHYHIIVTPENDGLSDDGWRVDKSGLTYSGPIHFKGYPSDYIVGDIGDKIHIWCDFTPSSAPFDIGLEYLEEDKAAGIYDYIIDDDGRGATLTLTGPGRGLIYMSAGPPINDAALFIIEVNLPELSQSRL